MAVAILFLLVTVTVGTAAAVESEPPAELWQRCDADAPAGQRCSSPSGVAADPKNGHVFVGDSGHSRILEFSPLGEFVKAWGWDVVQSGPGDTGAGFEVCVPENGDVCKQGLEGSRSGQFAGSMGLAADSTDSVYVVDRQNHRVQKFDHKGNFLLMFGGDVIAHGPDDSANHEVQELTIAASSGTFRLSFTNPFPEGGSDETPPLPFNAPAAQVEAALNGLSSISEPGGSVSVSGGPGDAAGSTPYLITFQGNFTGDDVSQLQVTLDVGTQLHCSTSTSAEAISYRWLRNGEPIGGATSASYTTTSSDRSKAIQCQVTATNANAGSTQVSGPPQVMSPSTVPLPLHPAPLAAPAASASLTVGGPGGQTLTCDPDEAGWQNLQRIWGYRWYRNGVQVESSGFGGAPSPTYTVKGSDLGTPAVFQCEVTVRGPGFPELQTTKTSEPLASSPAPSAPSAPEAQAVISPANLAATVTEGGGAEICKAVDVCKAGSEGTSPGEFGDWPLQGDPIAVDALGRVDVGDQYRIQRFDSQGVFLDEVPVPDESVESLDLDAAGNFYLTYSSEPKRGEIGTPKPVIHKLGASGEPLSPTFEIPAPDEFTHPTPTAVAVAPNSHVYAFSSAATGNGFKPLNRIFEFDPSGNLIREFGKGEFTSSFGLATNLCAGSEPPGNLLVTNSAGEGSSFVRAYGSEPSGCFAARTLSATNVAETSATLNGTVDPGGAPTSECRFEWGTTTAYGNDAPCAETPAEIGSGTTPVPVHADLSGLQPGTIYHVRLRARIGGETETGPDEEFKTEGPPVISDQHIVSATYTEATLKALVNPEGFSTTCQVDYGPTTSYGQSSASLQVGSDREAHAATILLSGLEPGTVYHWRFRCQNAALLNGGTADAEDRTLATYRLPQQPPPCPNDALRYGSSAALPDCRAYELVSPAEKNGADIVSGYPLVGEESGGYVQVSADGERITYAAKFPAFGEGLQNSFTFNQYLATRVEGEGWSNEPLHPPYSRDRLSQSPAGIGREFIAFSPDLCSSWLLDLQTPPLNRDAEEDAANLYRRQNCGAGVGSFETVTPRGEGPLPVSSLGRQTYVDRFSVQGVTADGEAAFFVAAAPLTADAAAGERPQVYERTGGMTHLVSVTPGHEAETVGAAIGSGWGTGLFGNLQGAVSADGSLVYWTGGITGSLGPGRIYLRRHPEQGMVAGECTKATKACTIPVSAGAQAVFWRASPDGTRALYSEDEKLYQFDLASEESHLLAEGALGVAGASQDLSRVYFVSRAALTGEAEDEANSFGDSPVAGRPNLYLAEGGGVSFIATLAEGDVGIREAGASASAYDVSGRAAFSRPTRVSGTGDVLAFESQAALSPYENTAPDGKAAVEVYAYDADSHGLLCVSCNPTGARPATRELPEPFKHVWEDDTETRERVRITGVQAAAWIPTVERAPHPSNVLSEDGRRLFFNSNDPLLPTDTNGAQDVYEWEAPGAGSCTTEDADYFSDNGGCLYLISSGESSFESEFWEASSDGAQVFFNTASSLLPQDPGSIDLYDGRVGGGFPQPPHIASCEGEACQSPPAAPQDPTPSSSSFQGAGNVHQAHRRCAKGKVKRHGRCVKKRHRHHKHRRAAR